MRLLFSFFLITAQLLQKSTQPETSTKQTTGGKKVENFTPSYGSKIAALHKLFKSVAYDLLANDVSSPEAIDTLRNNSTKGWSRGYNRLKSHL